jgi:hypothetical protein
MSILITSGAVLLETTAESGHAEVQCEIVRCICAKVYILNF